MDLLSATRMIAYDLIGRPSWGTASSSGITSNGWLPNKGRPTEEQRRENFKKKMRSYKKKPISPTWPDHKKVGALSSLISHIQNSYLGSRILILRAPTSNVMREFENERFPKASSFFERFAKKHKLLFYDCHQIWYDRKDEFFNDANHLSDQGANEHSKFLAKLLDGTMR